MLQFAFQLLLQVQLDSQYVLEGAPGLPRARPIARRQEHLDHHLQHLDFVGVHQWIEVAAQMRRRNMSCPMAPLQFEPAWNPQGKMTMSGDVPLVLRDIINSVLGPELQAEWDDDCLNLEIINFETWNETAWMMNNQAYGRRCQQQSLGATTAAEPCPNGGTVTRTAADSGSPC